MFCHACQVRRNNAKEQAEEPKGTGLKSRTRPFPNGTTKIMPVPDKAQKIFCIIVPNW